MRKYPGSHYKIINLLVQSETARVDLGGISRPNKLNIISRYTHENEPYDNQKICSNNI